MLMILMGDYDDNNDDDDSDDDDDNDDDVSVIRQRYLWWDIVIAGEQFDISVLEANSQTAEPTNYYMV